MKQIVVIGQAPAKPGSKHEVPGAYLRAWLLGLGLSEATIAERFLFLALIPSYPGSVQGGHLVPTAEQIAKHRPTLAQALIAAQPALVVPVGRLAINSLLEDANSRLECVIGDEYRADPYSALGRSVSIVPLPHPSGRSAWVHHHKDLLEKALHVLATKL